MKGYLRTAFETFKHFLESNKNIYQIELKGNPRKEIKQLNQTIEEETKIYEESRSKLKWTN